MGKVGRGMLKAVALVLVGILIVVFVVFGTGETATREAIRWTARLSFCLFCLAFAADGLPGRVGAAAVKGQALLSLALSHSVHALAVATLAVQTGGRNLMERSSPVDVLGGALAYAAIFWGALRPDSRLTSAGLFWVWGVFAVSYGGRAVRMPLPFALPMAMLVVGMAVRLFGSRRPATRSSLAAEAQHG